MNSNAKENDFECYQMSLNIIGLVHAFLCNAI